MYLAHSGNANKTSQRADKDMTSIAFIHFLSHYIIILPIIIKDSLYIQDI